MTVENKKNETKAEERSKYTLLLNILIALVIVQMVYLYLFGEYRPEDVVDLFLLLSTIVLQVYFSLKERWENFQKSHKTNARILYIIAVTSYLLAVLLIIDLMVEP